MTRGVYVLNEVPQLIYGAMLLGSYISAVEILVNRREGCNFAEYCYFFIIAKGVIKAGEIWTRQNVPSSHNSLRQKFLYPYNTTLFGDIYVVYSRVLLPRPCGKPEAALTVTVV